MPMNFDQLTMFATTERGRKNRSIVATLNQLFGVKDKPCVGIIDEPHLIPFKFQCKPLPPYDFSIIDDHKGIDTATATVNTIESKPKSHPVSIHDLDYPLPSILIPSVKKCKDGLYLTNNILSITDCILSLDTIFKYNQHNITPMEDDIISVKIGDKIIGRYGVNYGLFRSSLVIDSFDILNEHSIQDPKIVKLNPQLTREASKKSREELLKKINTKLEETNKVSYSREYEFELCFLSDIIDSFYPSPFRMFPIFEKHSYKVTFNPFSIQRIKIKEVY